MANNSGVQNVNMFKTQSPYEQQIEEMKRRQQMAEMLQQQSMQPLESQVAPGGMVVPTSPVLGLTKMLQAYMGGKQLRDIEKQRGEREQLEGNKAMNFLKDIRMGQQQPMSADDALGASLSATPTEAQRMPMSAMDKQGAMDAAMLGGSPQMRMAAQLAAMKPERNMKIADLNPKDFTSESWKKASQADDPSLLVGVAPKPDKPPQTKLSQLMSERAALVAADKTDPAIATYDAAIKRETQNAPSAAVTVNLDNKGDELSQKLYLEKIDKLSGPAKNAARIEAKLAEMEDATKKGTFTGAMAPNATGAAQFMSSFGINVKPEVLANTRTFEAASNQLVLDFMASNGGARGFTENETQMLRDAFPKIIDSPAARAQIAQLLRNRGKQDVQDYNDAVKTYKTTYPKSVIPYNSLESRSNWSK
jgi:hypothetical protein